MNIYRVSAYPKDNSDRRILLRVLAWNAAAAKTIASNHLQRHHPYTQWIVIYSSKVTELDNSPRFQRVLSEKHRV